MIDDLDARLARKLQEERQQREWSLADLSERSGVSKAMLSKIERGEASPTATLLARIASAFGQTLAQFLTFEDASERRLARSGELPAWRDPQTGYLRRQIYLGARDRLALSEIMLPPGAAVAFPASVYLDARHVIWVLAGRLTLSEGGTEHELDAGDRLELGEPADIVYRNATDGACRYLVVAMKV
jgi:transcriptional regulator with XRE-family HTH domain